MNDTAPQSPFSRLDTNLMRSTKLQEKELPASHIASKTVDQQAILPARRQDRKPALQQASTPTEKVTYRFHPHGVKAIKQIQWLLLNDYEIKADLAEIAEEAILMVHEELLSSQQDSNIVVRLASKPARQKNG